MITKLPPWVLIGGGVLTFIAGTINAVGFLGLYHQGITHLTGTTTLLGIAVAEGNGDTALHLFAFLASFLAGATASGFIVQDGALRMGRRYGMALVVESALLFLSIPLLKRGDFSGHCIASCACGLQNAMVTTFSGASLRTTHVSGVFTDLGVFIGHWLRGMPVDFRRLRLWLLLIFFFGGGGTVGALMFARFGYNTLFLSAILTGLAGLAYGIYRSDHRAGHSSPG